MKLPTITKMKPVLSAAGKSILLLLLMILTPVPAAAQVEAQEYEVKAAFLYQFANYVEWPAETFSSQESPLVFGILNADDLAENLEQMVVGRSVQGRTIEVRRLQSNSSLDGVHVLFVGREANGVNEESLLLDAASMSVLTVTETPPHPSGSVINFEIVDNRVRFDIALMPAEEGNLRISSRLLQIAQSVSN